MSEVIFNGNVVEIPLTKGKVAIVDFDVFCSNALFGFPWRTLETEYAFYAVRSVRCTEGSQKTTVVLMHRIIMKPLSDQGVDHRDGNGLNNLKENLRVCTKSQNAANAKIKASHFKGIFRDRQKWGAQIAKDGRKYCLGSYKTEEEAARAYDRKAVELYGEFARLNFT